MSIEMRRVRGGIGGIATCPSCHNEVNSFNYRVDYESGESFIYKCPFCDLMFMYPLMLSELTKRPMESVDDADMFNSSVLKRLHEQLIVKKEIAVARALLGRHNFSLLDVGCGTGWISAIWRDLGADVTGLEPSASRRRIARERHGIRVLDSFVEELGSEESFDVVTIRHVLEHLENPLEALRHIHSHTRHDGLLVVVVPNIDCLGRFLFDTRWSWILPWHCLFFNPRSLQGLVERAGFKVENVYQTPSPLWYPESFFRVLPGSSELRERFYARLNIWALLPFAPLVAAGYLSGFSDNITLIARACRHK